MVATRPRGREQVVAAIIGACERLSERSVPSAFTIKDLAEEAGVTTSLLYHYFDSKDSIIAETLRSISSEIDDAAAQAGDEPIDVLRSAAEFVWDRPAFTRIVTDLALEGRDVTAMMGDHPVLRRLRSAFASSGVGDPDIDTGAALLAVVASGAIGRVVNVALGRDPRDPAVVERMVRRLGATSDAPSADG